MIVNVVLSLVSGLLTGLSFNFSNLSFLVWFSLVPFIHAISKSSLKGGVLSGAVFGLCYYGVAIFWIGNVTKLGLIFLLLYLSFYCVLFFIFGRYFLTKPLRIVALSCLWVVLEFLKENIWCGFGWANLAYSQYRNFYLIQVADLWGAKFISFLIVVVNVFIWEVFYRWKQDNGDKRSKQNIFRKTVFIIFIFLACFLYSFYRLKSLSPLITKKDSLEVSIIQPNVSQELKWKHSAIPSIIDKLNILGKRTKEDALVIFPEAAWPLTVNEGNIKEFKEFISDVKRDIIMGVVIEDKGKFYNTALLFDKKATLKESYRKIKLVPFGEYVPLRRFLNFVSVINSIGDITAGSKIIQFSYKKKKFSVFICFEDVSSLDVLRFSRKNDFLINITNDAWFGGEPQASQHLSIMVLRAVENRIPIVRSANTGISGWVSSSGEIEKLKKAKEEVFFSGIGNFDVSLNNKRSFYNKYGEIFPLFCGMFILGIFVMDKKNKINVTDSNQ